ncbi:hypothetical protein CKO11_04790 [Rhodobacter sp. TJ_12]|uniref:response regulator n=1 Tax=Rhodobacter sp. TJ_12 TaxID=2029399 RepID=UPI001CC00E5C|nr:response regulator [Rhodobacter sp. TJ_12]MBZ4021776.1 hypothetical protein [Rhodobacter sp. TJ_12]
MARILYIDDDNDIREIAVMALELNELFEVRSAASGASGLEIAREYTPDLILLDVMMPGLDGPATYRLVKLDPALQQTPVAFITARTQTHQVAELMGMGACSVIPKPFDPMALAGQVESLLLQC